MTHPEWPRSSFLGRISHEALDDLLRQGTRNDYTTNRKLLNQGDDSRHVLLITKGVVKVVTSSRAGYEMLVAVRWAGDVVGEMSAFEGRPRSGSVIACGRVTARVIQCQEFQTFLSRHPETMKVLCGMLSSRLRRANQRRLDFKAHEPDTRLARVLVELAQMSGQQAERVRGRERAIEAALTQPELASLAGIALSTAEKNLAKMDQDGILRREYRRLTITDFSQLLALAKISDENPY